MHTRALGKALGRQFRCGQRPGPRWARVLVVATLWTFSTGVTSEPGTTGGRLPAFHEIDQLAVRKQSFFEYLTPMIRSENELIRRQRRQLLVISDAWRAGASLGWFGYRYLDWLAVEYRLPQALSTGELIEKLLERVDVIPRSLVLAQAAKESAWGCSRFARRGNNLFGQWCFESGCGMVPRQRPAGMTHEVRSFMTVRDSVASYMRNLNTHDGYRDLRELRRRLREQGQPLSGVMLARGLSRYSERGQRYVHEVQAVIRQNGLELADVSTAVAGG